MANIIGALPVTLTNGTTADATQVMSNFNSVVSQVNANGASLIGGNAFTGAQTIGGDAVVTASVASTVSNKTFLGPNGSLTAPTYSFALATETGICLSSSNNLVLTMIGVAALTVDASQNVGIGVTPSAWSLSGFRGFEVGIPGNGFFSGSNDLNLSCNAYYNQAGGGWTYASTGFATEFEQTLGAHIWRTAPSGTIGTAVPFIQAMTLDSHGRLYGSAFHNNSTSPSGSTNQFIASGTYVPGLSSPGNIAASSAGAFQWIRVGNVVTVSGKITISTTSAGGASIIMGIPLASSTVNLSGSVQGNFISGTGVFSQGGGAQINATSTSTSSSNWYVSFSYEIV